MVTEAVDNDPLVGTLIDNKYRIIEKIGGGGMGIVYKATHELMGRTVALKVLRRHLAEGEEEAQFLERFRREAHASARIEHPNAVIIYDFGTHDEAPFLVMQYIEGQTLKQILACEGALELPRIILLILQVSGAVHEAHLRGIIHRDLKPDNIMVSEKSDGTERAVVLDFGIAKMLGPENQEDASVTRTGNIMGTPHYMAPEQVRGGSALDARSDIYSIGVMLYEMCTGVVPFSSDSAVGVMMKHLREDPPPFSSFSPTRRQPKELEAIVRKALQKDPAKRHQSLPELSAELEELAVKYKVELGTGSFRRDQLLDQSPAEEVQLAAGKYFRSFKGMHVGLILGAVLLLGIGIQQLLSAGLSESSAIQAAPGSGAESEVQESPLVESEPAPEPAPVASTQPALEINDNTLSDKASALFERASKAQENGAIEEAETLLKELLLEANTYAPAYEKLGDIYLGLNRLNEAAEMFEQSLGFAADNYAAFSKLAYSYGQLDRLNEAIKAYQEAIQLKPDYALAHNNLGFIYLRQGKLQEAEEAFKQSLRIDSSYARAYFNLAQVYEQKEEWDRAVLAHRGGVKADPENAPARYVLGRAYEKAGELEKAIKSYRDALSIDPDYSQAQERLRELEAET